MVESKDQQNDMESLLKTLPEEEKGKAIESLVRMAEPAIESAIHNNLHRAIRETLREFCRSREMSGIIRDSMQDIGYTREVAGLVHSLAAQSQDSEEEVFKKALNLYKFALDARAEGNRVAILNPDDEIVHEVVGFEPASTSTPPKKVAG